MPGATCSSKFDSRESARRVADLVGEIRIFDRSRQHHGADAGRGNRQAPLPRRNLAARVGPSVITGRDVDFKHVDQGLEHPLIEARTFGPARAVSEGSAISGHWPSMLSRCWREGPAPFGPDRRRVKPTPYSLGTFDYCAGDPSNTSLITSRTISVPLFDQCDIVVDDDAFRTRRRIAQTRIQIVR